MDEENPEHSGWGINMRHQLKSADVNHSTKPESHANESQKSNREVNHGYVA